MITNKTKDNTGDNNIANHNAIPNASFNTQSTIIDITAHTNALSKEPNPDKPSTSQFPDCSSSGPKVRKTINPITPTKILANISQSQLIINLLLI